MTCELKSKISAKYMVFRLLCCSHISDYLTCLSFEISVSSLQLLGSPIWRQRVQGRTSLHLVLDSLHGKHADATRSLLWTRTDIGIAAPKTYISRNICFNFEFEKDLYICPFETFWKQKAESKTQGCIKNHVSASRWDDSDPARTYFFCCGLDRCVWIRRAPHIRPELTKLV